MTVNALGFVDWVRERAAAGDAQAARIDAAFRSSFARSALVRVMAEQPGAPSRVEEGARIPWDRMVQVSAPAFPGLQTGRVWGFLLNTEVSPPRLTEWVGAEDAIGGVGVRDGVELPAGLFQKESTRVIVTPYGNTVEDAVRAVLLGGYAINQGRKLVWPAAQKIERRLIDVLAHDEHSDLLAVRTARQKLIGTLGDVCGVLHLDERLWNRVSQGLQIVYPHFTGSIGHETVWLSDLGPRKLTTLAADVWIEGMQIGGALRVERGAAIKAFRDPDVTAGRMVLQDPEFGAVHARKVSDSDVARAGDAPMASVAFEASTPTWLRDFGEEAESFHVRLGPPRQRGAFDRKDVAAVLEIEQAGSKGLRWFEPVESYGSAALRDALATLIERLESGLTARMEQGIFAALFFPQDGPDITWTTQGQVRWLVYARPGQPFDPSSPDVGAFVVEHGWGAHTAPLSQLAAGQAKEYPMLGDAFDAFHGGEENRRARSERVQTLVAERTRSAAKKRSMGEVEIEVERRAELDPRVRTWAQANPLDTFLLVLKDVVENAILAMHSERWFHSDAEADGWLRREKLDELTRDVGGRLYRELAEPAEEEPEAEDDVLAAEFIEQVREQVVEQAVRSHERWLRENFDEIRGLQRDGQPEEARFRLAELSFDVGADEIKVDAEDVFENVVGPVNTEAGKQRFASVFPTSVLVQIGGRVRRRVWDDVLPEYNELAAQVGAEPMEPPIDYEALEQAGQTRLFGSTPTRPAPDAPPAPLAPSTTTTPQFKPGDWVRADNVTRTLAKVESHGEWDAFLGTWRYKVRPGGQGPLTTWNETGLTLADSPAVSAAVDEAPEETAAVSRVEYATSKSTLGDQLVMQGWTLTTPSKDYNPYTADSADYRNRLTGEKGRLTVISRKELKRREDEGDWQYVGEDRVAFEAPEGWLDRVKAAVTQIKAGTSAEAPDPPDWGLNVRAHEITSGDLIYGIYASEIRLWRVEGKNLIPIATSDTSRGRRFIQRSVRKGEELDPAVVKRAEASNFTPARLDKNAPEVVGDALASIGVKPEQGTRIFRQSGEGSGRDSYMFLGRIGGVAPEKKARPDPWLVPLSEEDAVQAQGEWNTLGGATTWSWLATLAKRATKSADTGAISKAIGDLLRETGVDAQTRHGSGTVAGSVDITFPVGQAEQLQNILAPSQIYDGTASFKAYAEHEDRSDAQRDYYDPGGARLSPQHARRFLELYAIAAHALQARGGFKSEYDAPTVLGRWLFQQVQSVVRPSPAAAERPTGPGERKPSWGSPTYGAVQVVEGAAGKRDTWHNISAVVDGKRMRYGYSSSAKRWARKEIPPVGLLQEVAEHGYGALFDR